jgi:ABC-type multidrug transport system permease subunit
MNEMEIRSGGTTLIRYVLVISQYIYIGLTAITVVTVTMVMAMTVAAFV